jgi:lysophospholipase L1-like esterase
MRRARALRIVGNVLLAACSVALTLGLFEVGLRAADYRPLHEMYSAPSVFWVHEPTLGWAHEPGARGRFVGPRPWPIEFETEVAINSAGLRGPEVGARERGELRVLFLGDSIVAGFEVADEETFVRVLEPVLERRLGRRVRTLNGGVRGYGTDQALLFYRERGRALAPDAVVIVMSRNDFSDNRTLHEARRPFGKPVLVANGESRLAIAGAPVPRYDPCEQVYLSIRFEVVRGDSLFSRMVCRAQMALLDHSALFTLFTISVPWNHDLLVQLYNLANPHEATRRPSPDVGVFNAHTHAILIELIAEVRRDGAVTVVAGGRDELEAYDLHALAAEDALVVDLSEVWNAPASEVRWNHDSHFNPEGHRRVASLLAPSLEATLRSEPGPVATNP